MDDAPTPPAGLAEAVTPPHGTPLPPAVQDTGTHRPVPGRPAARRADGGVARTGSHRVAAHGTGSHRVGADGTGSHRAARAAAAGAPSVRTGSHRASTGVPAHPGAPAEPVGPAAPAAPDEAPVPEPDEPAAPADTADQPAPADQPAAHSRRVTGRTRAERRPRSRSRARAAPAEPPVPTGHGHGHGPAAPASRRVLVVIACLLVPAMIATIAGLVLLHPGGRPQATEGAAALPRVGALVTAATPADCEDGSGEGGCIALTVVPEAGTLGGQAITVLISAPQPGRGATAAYAVGDPVELVWAGDPADPASYEVSDFQRGVPLSVLALLFALAVVVLGRWQGLKALVALGLTGVVLVTFVLPAILAGEDPLWVAVVGSCAIMFVVLYLTHGFSARTSTAVLGTLASLLLIGLLGVVFAAATRLTGLDEDTANLGAALGASVDGRGLVLAGLIIGALGALDDVTVTQTSAVWELRAANPTMRAAHLFGSAMRIGRDHVASAVNTLVLAYAGAALPLLLLFAVAERGLGDALTTQVIATEVVRTLVGSIGIVASVPLTTALAVLVSAGGRPR